MARQKRVLIIVRGHLGDVVRALPVFRDVRQAYPRAHIAVFANEHAVDALTHCPFVDEVIAGFFYYSRPRLARWRRQLTILLRLVGQFDTVIALGWSPPLAPVLALLMGARERVGFSASQRLGRLLTHDLGRQPTTISNRLINMMPLSALGIAASPRLPRIDWLSPAVTARAGAILQTAGLPPGQRYAVLHISSDWGCNEWRSNKWAAVADYLFEEHGLAVVVVGTDAAHEVAKLREVTQLARHEPLSALGQTSKNELFAVVAHASLVVATDSAITQIAMAQQVPSVVLFHTEPLALNGPLPAEMGVLMEPIQYWDASEDNLLNTRHCQFAAGACHWAYCKENRSLRQIEVDDVKARVSRLLRTRQAEHVGTAG